MAVDLDQSRLDLAGRIGADTLVNARADDPVEVVKRVTEGHMADCVLHCAAGPHVEAFETSQRLCRTGGRVVLIGIHSAPLTILRHEFLHKDLLGGGAGYDYDPALFDVRGATAGGREAPGGRDRDPQRAVHDGSGDLRHAQLPLSRSGGGAVEVGRLMRGWGWDAVPRPVGRGARRAG